MNCQTQNRVILIMIGLMVVFAPLSEAATFSLNEVPLSPPQHAVGEEFDCEFRIDATTQSLPEPLPLQPIGAISILVTFDETKITPVNNPPFTQGAYPPGAIVFDNQFMSPNQLKYTATIFGGGGGSRSELNGLMATVRFRQIALGIASVAWQNVGTDTFFTTTADLLTLIPPTTIDGEHSLAVTLSAFTGSVSDKGVRIQWRTQTETNNLGFNVYRSEIPEGNFEKINLVLIRGAGTDATPQDYQFMDENAEPGKVYYYYIQDLDFTGATDKSTLLVVDLTSNRLQFQARFLIPRQTRLLQNFPNPFNPETWLPFHLASDAEVAIRIFNSRGETVRLVPLGRKSAGYYDTRTLAAYWDGKNETSHRVASGLYFYTLKADTFTATRKMHILK